MAPRLWASYHPVPTEVVGHQPHGGFTVNSRPRNQAPHWTDSTKKTFPRRGTRQPVGISATNPHTLDRFSGRTHTPPTPSLGRTKKNFTGEATRASAGGTRCR